MKKNQKLLRKVLKDIRHDMTDDEVLNLLADSKFSQRPDSEKNQIHAGAARRRHALILTPCVGAASLSSAN